MILTRQDAWKTAALLTLAVIAWSATGCSDVDDDKKPRYTEADCVEYSVTNALSTVQCPDGSLMGDKL